MKKNIEIIALVYKSINYVNLIYDELKSDKCKVDGWDVGLRLVLNDATDEVINRVKELDINYTIYNDKTPTEYYLNRVYRAWNYGGNTSDFDNVCFVNSDMVFSENWLDNLLKHHNGINIPTSRLVESGKMTSGTYGISKNFGRSPLSIDRQGFYDFARAVSVDKTQPGGLFMPVILEKKKFVESGMFPEGNIYTTGVGNFGDPFIQSGDLFYFRKLESEYGMKHITIFDSIVYHIQEGEMGEA